MTRRPFALANRSGRSFGDEVDHVLFECSVIRQADGLAHRLLRPVRVASVQCGETADIGDRVVGHLCQLGVAWHDLGGLICFVAIASRLDVGTGQRRRGEQRDRRRGTEIGARRHCRERGGVKYVGAGAGRPGSARRDICKHRHARGQHGSDDVAHRTVQSPRRVHAQYDHRGVAPLRIIQTAHHVARATGPDRAIERNHHSRARRRERGRARECH